MRLRRMASCGVVSVTGAAVFVPNVARLVVPTEPPLGLMLAVVGAVLSLVLMGLGIWLFHGDLPTQDTTRIAALNAATVLALGAMLSMVLLYQEIDAPVALVGNLLAVSAFANVVVGVEGVRTIRAEKVAAEREKLLVLNRLLRHNLRNEAQVLLAAGNHLRSTVEDPDDVTAADSICRSARTLGNMKDNVEVIQRAVDEVATPARTEVTAPVARAVERASADAGPTATSVSTDLPASCHALATDQLETAVAELVENALVHAGGTEVRVAVACEDAVTVSVVDDGTGVPAVERAVIAGDRAITQLEHGSGLGLWMVRWVVDAMDGEFELRESDAGGTAAVIRLQSA